MNRKLLIWILGLIFTLAVITGCRGSKAKTSDLQAQGAVEKATPGQETTVEATPVPKPEAAKSTVTGKVFSTTVSQPYPKAPVWLAEVYRQGGDGVYVLDHAFSPAVYADENGVFTISNVDPKDYVIVIGDPEGLYEVIPDDSGKARVWTLDAGKVLDVGQLSVSLSPP
jgi:hypothetical protein